MAYNIYGTWHLALRLLHLPIFGIFTFRVHLRNPVRTCEKIFVLYLLYSRLRDCYLYPSFLEKLCKGSAAAPEDFLFRAGSTGQHSRPCDIQVPCHTCLPSEDVQCSNYANKSGVIPALSATDFRHIALGVSFEALCEQTTSCIGCGDGTLSDEFFKWGQHRHSDRFHWLWICEGTRTMLNWQGSWCWGVWKNSLSNQSE